MSTAFESLPPEVQDALRRGKPADAAQLLRKAKGIAAKSAQARIEQLLSQGIPSGGGAMQASRSPRQPVAPTGAPYELGAVAGRLLGVLLEAARRRSGGDASVAAELAATPSSLAPGEQPRFEHGGLLAAVLALLALAAVLIFYR